MSSPNTVKTGMLFLSMEKFINGILTILLIPVMIRIIGIEQYGLWAIILAAFSYMQCMDLGVSFALERNIAYYHGLNNQPVLQKLITTAITWMLLLCAVTFLFFYFSGNTLINLLIKEQQDLPSAHMLLFCFPAVAANFIQQAVMCIPRGLRKFDISSKIQIGGKLVFTAALLLGFMRWKTVYSPLLAYTLQTVFTMTSYIIAAKVIAPDLHLFRLAISVRHLRELLAFGGRIQISSLSFLFTQHFDKLLLSSFFGLTYTGYYEVATKVIYAIRDIPLFLMSVLTPHISNQLSQNRIDEIKNLYRNITSQLAVISFFLAGLLLVNHRHILTFILKAPPTSFSLLVFQLLAATGFWHVISGGSTYVSRGMGKTSVEMNTNILTLTLNVTLSLIFMKIFSYRGVVFGTATAFTFSPVLSYYLTNRIFNISTGKFLIRSFLSPVLSGTIAVLPVLFIDTLLPPTFSPVISMFLLSTVFLINTHAAYILTRNRVYGDLLSRIPVISRYTGK